MTGDPWRQRLTAVVAPALFVVLPLCLFGPHTIYSGNEAEFSAPFWVLVRPLLVAGALAAALLILAGVVLSPKVRRAYVALLFGVGLVLWIQANFLVANYAAFTGAAVDFSVESWRNPYEITLWALVPLLSVLGARYVSSVAPFASATLIVLQAAALIVAVSQAEPGRSAWKGPSEAMFDLSRRQNVLHIVLDGFQSELFHEILAENRPLFDRSWSGATFFADHAGAFPSTIVSIPAMLTGSVYRNERHLQRYIRDHFEQGSLFKSLRAGGYRVDSVTEMRYDNQSATNFFRMPRPYVAYSEYIRFGALQLADLSLFRHAPHILRPKIYNDDKWFLQTRYGPGDTTSRRLHPVNGAAVLGEFSRRLRPAIDEPLYKFIHVGIPHMPLAVGADCEYTGITRVSREGYKAQARCAVNRVTAILDRLKDIGVYDNTLVVVASDHGLGFTPKQFANDRQLPPAALSTLAARSMALLVVKPRGAHGAVRVSYAPTAITDIPATILDAAGVSHTLPGTPALKLEEHARRPRMFAMYDWEHEDWKQAYFDVLDVMAINGRLLDGNNWKFVESVYSPNAGPEARTRGLYETHRSRSGAVYRWSMPQAFFDVPPDARWFEVSVRSIAPTPQTVTLLSGDHVVDAVTLRDQSWVTLKKPLPPPQPAGARWIEMRVEPPWRPRGTRRMLGVQTREVRWSN